MNFSEKLWLLIISKVTKTEFHPLSRKDIFRKATGVYEFPQITKQY